MSFKFLDLGFLALGLYIPHLVNLDLLDDVVVSFVRII